MPIIDKPFPKYRNPPVVEVALGVQFQELTGLRILQLANLWNEYRAGYPKVEEHPRLDDATERFDQPEADLTIQATSGLKLPLQRLWFISDDDTRLIQVQSSRFIFNWRARQQQGTYPSFENIRAEFAEEFGRFVEFVDTRGLGKVRPNQCEVSYFNHIRPSQLWQNHGELDKVLAFCSAGYSDDFLPEPETAKFAVKFQIKDINGNRAGRLNVRLDPGFLKQDESPIWSLTLTARGNPNGDDLNAVFRFMDLGHEWVVRGFTSLTTPAAHKIWGRQDGDTD